MEKLRCEKLFDNQVWKLVLNDPKGNVVDGIMLDSFDAVLDEAAQDKHCKLIILQGEGKHFSFGVSVPDHTADKAAAMLTSFHRFFFKLYRSGYPGGDPHVRAVPRRRAGDGHDCTRYFCRRNC